MRLHPIEHKKWQHTGIVSNYFWSAPVDARHKRKRGSRMGSKKCDKEYAGSVFIIVFWIQTLGAALPGFSTNSSSAYEQVFNLSMAAERVPYS